MTYLDRLPLAGELVATGFAQWSTAIRQEFEDYAYNGRVGGRLLLEDERTRVWDIRLEPGERVAAHRHVLDYFWTALTDGQSLQHTHDGTTRTVRYTAGDTRAYTFRSGEFLLHDLQNTGDDVLAFITVELKYSANQPLPL
ncbi:hypothetical protein PV664_35460 [Streptomyces sp. ME01-18a]|uniref:hypothetical protein n=1 Tax=Streptomyces sp. ME01-18a TaxID=3028669 RepID=UPI0029B4BDB5|nr:hypothetical protein [Streptomyces sp. ME01-18a]MDX3434166.1 hypothetical protein [Streptomyces sp. ME01-18a]